MQRSMCTVTAACAEHVDIDSLVVFDAEYTQPTATLSYCHNRIHHALIQSSLVRNQLQCWLASDITAIMR